jgi:hypothetical protein
MDSAPYTSLAAACSAAPDPRHACGCRYPWSVLRLLIAPPCGLTGNTAMPLLSGLTSTPWRSCPTCRVRRHECARL